MAKLLKHFYIEPDQVVWLENQSKQTGESQAEIIRKLIKKRMNDQDKTK